MHYEYSIPLDFFKALREGQTAMGYERFGKANGHPGPHFPEELLKPIGPDDTVTYTVPIPPGLAQVTWQVQANDDVIAHSVNGGPEQVFHPLLWPDGAATQKLETATLSFRPTRPGVLPILLWVNWMIKDPALYSAWIAAKRPAAPSAPPPPSPPPAIIKPTLDQRALVYAKRGGLADALRTLSGTVKDDDLQAWVLRQPGLWLAICRTVEIAEGGAHA